MATPCTALVTCLAMAATLACGDGAGRAHEDAAAHEDAQPLDGTALCQGSYGRLEEWGTLADAALVEASGLVASHRSPGVYWSHNDSGDGARLFALALDGRALARLTLPGVTAVDFEDIAAGPCPDGSGPCLFIADTGNNALDRTEVAVYAVPEPGLDVGAGFVDLEASAVVRIPVAFAADVVDIEALAVAPTGQELFFFEKNNLDTARVFRIAGPFAADQVRTLEEIATIDAPGLPVEWGRAITGADMHATGARMLVRVYTGVYEYRLDPGAGVAGMAAIEPVLAVAGPLLEPQGEAVAYDAAGSGIVTVSEDPNGMPGQGVHHYRCE